MALVSQAPATLWILYGQDRFGWSMMVAGLSLAGYGTCHALSQAFAIGPLVARFGERKALLIGPPPTPWARRCCLSPRAAGRRSPCCRSSLRAAWRCPLQALMAHKVDDDHQGELQGRSPAWAA